MKLLLTAGFLIFAAILIQACGNDKQAEQKVKNTIETAMPAEVAALQRSLESEPNNSAARLQLINSLDSLQLYTQAIRQTDSLIKKDSLNNEYWFLKGQLQESSGDTANAIISYERAVRIYPSEKILLYLANLFAEKKNKKALFVCQNIRNNTTDRETLAYCDFIEGIYFARINEDKKALESFEKALIQNYTLMEAYMEKGFILYDNKKWKDAAEVFNTAITVKNTYADAYYWLAKTQEAMNNHKDALLNYQRSYGLDKTLTQAKTAIERLSQ